MICQESSVACEIFCEHDVLYGIANILNTNSQKEANTSSEALYYSLRSLKIIIDSCPENPSESWSFPR